MNAPDLTVTPASAADVAYAERLVGEAELPTVGLREDAVELFVGRVDGERVGVGGLEAHGNAVLVRSVAIEPSRRTNGYGAGLVERLLDRARKRGVEEAYLLTTTAADFFAVLGFEAIDRERAPKRIRETTEFAQLCPETAICMRRNLR